MGRTDGRTILEVLDVARSRHALASALAWLLDPEGEHGLGDRAARRLGELLGREALSPDSIEEREAILSGARGLKGEPPSRPSAEVQVDADGPAVHLVVGEQRLLLVPPRSDEGWRRPAGPGAPVRLAWAPLSPASADQARPATVLLGELADGLHRPAAGPFGVLVDHLREHLLRTAEAWRGLADARARSVIPTRVLNRPTASADRPPPPPAPLPVAPPPPVAVDPSFGGEWGAAPDDWALQELLAQQPPEPAPPPPKPATPAPRPAARKSGVFERPAPAAPATPPPPRQPTPAAGVSTKSGRFPLPTPAGGVPAAGTSRTPVGGVPVPGTGGTPVGGVPVPGTGRFPRPGTGRFLRQSDSHLDLQLGEATEGTRAVVELVQSFKKAIRALRLYPGEHPLVGEAIETSARLLAEHQGRHGVLELQITRDGVSFQGAPLVAELGSTTDLSFLLYPEGVRTLTFEVGADRAEVRGFVEALSGRDPTTLTADNDVLGALWRRGLRHIHYLAFDALSPAAVRASHDPAIRELALRIQRTAGHLDRASLEREAALERALTKAATREPLATRGEEARAALVADLRGGAGDLIVRSALAVGWAGSTGKGALSDEDVARFFAGAVTSALWQGDLARAAEVLATVHAQGGASGALIARLVSPDGQLLLVRALRDAAARAAPLEDELPAYLEQLGPASVELAAHVYGRLADPALRAVVRGHLRGALAEAPAPLVPLTLHPDAAVAAEALDLLLGGLAHKKVREVVQGLADDASAPERQRRAAAAIDDVTGEGERRRLLQLLEKGTDKVAWLEAAKRLPAAADARTFDQLVALIQRRDFLQRDDQQVDAALGALTAIGGFRAARVLQELSEQRSLLTRKDTQRVASAAARWLSRLGEAKK